MLRKRPWVHRGPKPIVNKRVFFIDVVFGATQSNLTLFTCPTGTACVLRGFRVEGMFDEVSATPVGLAVIGFQPNSLNAPILSVSNGASIEPAKNVLWTKTAVNQAVSGFFQFNEPVKAKRKMQEGDLITFSYIASAANDISFTGTITMWYSS